MTVFLLVGRGPRTTAPARRVSWEINPAHPPLHSGPSFWQAGWISGRRPSRTRTNMSLETPSALLTRRPCFWFAGLRLGGGRNVLMFRVLMAPCTPGAHGILHSPHRCLGAMGLGGGPPRTEAGDRVARRARPTLCFLSRPPDLSASILPGRFVFATRAAALSSILRGLLASPPPILEAACPGPGPPCPDCRRSAARDGSCHLAWLGNCRPLGLCPLFVREWLVSWFDRRARLFTRPS